MRNYIIVLKKISILSLITIFIVTGCQKDNDDNNLDPELRFFRFKSCPENSHGNWQDTSFIAATKNPAVIEKCLEELTLPIMDRRLFPLGKIDHGDGGYNQNGPHSFNWHFIEDSWELVELGIEIYDGCAYSDVELTNYTDNLGSYGGWSNIILEEVFFD